MNTATSVSAPSSANEGSTITVKVTTASGNAAAIAGSTKVTFAGQTVTRSVSNGSASVSFKAPSVSKNTKYTISASFTAATDSVYKNSSGSKSITVVNTTATKKSTTSISAPGSVKGGKSFTVKVKTSGSSGKVAGTIKIKFNGKTITKSISNGSTSVSFKAPKVKKNKKYSISATYTPKKDSVYKASSKSKSITVKKK
ncbi:hypothetical protein [Aeromicrobium sp. UC242_57]|uniref:hypothetical protein n=1 Tax=Aeromicrobium sp. UC242_57 TaxID=3374624 RepID=UPI0037BBC543